MKDYQVKNIKGLPFLKIHLWARLHYYSHHISFFFLIFMWVLLDRVNNNTLMVISAIILAILMFLVYVWIKFKILKQYQLQVKESHILAVNRTLFNERQCRLNIENIHTVFIGIDAKSIEDIEEGKNLKSRKLFSNLTIWLKDGDKFVLNNAIEAFELKSLDGFMLHLEKNGIKVASPHSFN